MRSYGGPSLSLFAADGDESAQPMSLSFAKSPWAKLGECLYNWFSREQYELHSTLVGQLQQWTFSTKDSRLEVSIPPE